MSIKVQLERPPKTNWREIVSRMVKAEMQKRGLKYEDLRVLLEEGGTNLNHSNLKNKVNRGIMGADLFLQIMLVMGAKLPDESTLDEYRSALQP